MPEPEMPQPEPETAQETGTAPESPKRATVADAIADFVQMIVDYVRQETGDVVHDKVVVPTQKAGQVIAFAMAAALVLFLGIGYISVALMMILASYAGWPAALLIIGGVLVVGAGGLTYMKMRRLQ
jgi:hypothetical protein